MQPAQRSASMGRTLRVRASRHKCLQGLWPAYCHDNKTMWRSVSSQNKLLFDMYFCGCLVSRRDPVDCDHCSGAAI